MKELNKLTLKDAKYLAKPGGIFALTLIIFGLVIYFGVNSLKTANAKVKTSQRLGAVLSKNVSLLNTVDEEISSGQSFIEVALPKSNSSIYFMSQIKILASQKGLLLTNIKNSMSAEAGKGLEKSSVSFDVEGSIDAISDFEKELAKILPIGNLVKVKTVVSGSNARSSLAVDVYSAELPKKIPSLTTPITSLNQEEKKLLLDISQYTLPAFVKPEPQGANVRENPFN